MPGNGNSVNLFSKKQKKKLWEYKEKVYSKEKATGKMQNLLNFPHLEAKSPIYS